MLAVQLGMANQYIRDLSVNVKRGNRAKLEKGEWPNHAPFGYLNDKATKTIKVDESKAPYIVRIFELYSTGSYLLREVVKILYQEGLRTNSGKKVIEGSIHRILSRPFYYGMMLRDGKYYKGNHTPIISKELFDRAQDVLHGRIHPRAQKYFFPLRGFMKCASCGCALTATTKKGHVYYYCTNGKKICTEHKKYLRSDEVDKLIMKKLKEARFDPELIEIAYQARKEMVANESDTKETLLANARKALELATLKESRLLDTYLSGLVAEDAYKAKMAEIRENKIALELDMERIEKAVHDPSATLERTKKVFLTANNAFYFYKRAKDEQKRKLLETLLWNFSLQGGKIASAQYKTPFNFIFEGGKIDTFPKMLAVWESNLSFLSGRRELNPVYILPKYAYYRYTTPRI